MQTLKKVLVVPILTRHALVKGIKDILHKIEFTTKIYAADVYRVDVILSRQIIVSHVMLVSV